MAVEIGLHTLLMGASSVNILTKFPNTLGSGWQSELFAQMGGGVRVCAPGFCARTLTVMGLTDWFGNYVLIWVAALFMVTIIKDLGSHLWARWLWPQSRRCVCVYWQQPITLRLTVVSFHYVWPLQYDFSLTFGFVKVGHLKLASLVSSKCGSR